jgi:2-polyprenyl-6-methoxyphenol hydroxylase-like FAD-dependent oxidoreductase
MAVGTEGEREGEGERYDAVVVGARIAGCAAAYQLASRGWHVALVERARRPLPNTLSLPVVFARGLAQFDALGLGPVVSSLLPQLHHLRAVDFRLTGGIRIAGPCTPYASYDFAVMMPRLIVDDALLDYVLTRDYPAGGSVTLYQGTLLEDLLRAPSGTVRGAVVRPVAKTAEEQHHADLSARRLLAPLVVGADGRFSKVASLVGAAKYNIREPRTTAYYQYCRGLDLEGLADGAYFLTGDQRGVFLGRVAGELQAIGVFFALKHFPAFRADPRGEIVRTVAQVPALSGRLAGFRVADSPLDKVLGLSPTQGYFRPAGGPGWVLVGDAAHWKDPASGQGFHDALLTVGELMAALQELSGGKPLSADDATRRWPRAAARMQHRRDGALRSMYAFTYAFGDMMSRQPNRFERALLTTISNDERLTAAFIGILTGATDPAVFNRRALLHLARRLVPVSFSFLSKTAMYRS